MRRHHLDHASTTPLRPEARAAIIELLADETGAPFADPSRRYHDALTARAHLEDARDRIAARLGARPREVVFTSGATESIMTAAWGGAQRGSHQVLAAVEHSAVRDAVERHHPGTVPVGVGADGRIDANSLLAAIDGNDGDGVGHGRDDHVGGRDARTPVGRPDDRARSRHAHDDVHPRNEFRHVGNDRDRSDHDLGSARTAGIAAGNSVRADPAPVSGVGGTAGMVHCQWVNHEVGTVQPIEAVVAGARASGVLSHVDAAQAIGRLPFDFAALGADFVSISSHKVGGPAGIGVLLVRRGVRIDPLVVGGDQERARRGGMEHVLGAVGLAAALDALDADTVAAEADRARAQTARLHAALLAVDGVEVFGPTDRAGRAPHLLAAGIADIEPQAIIGGLDRAGVNAHSGSACASEGFEPSPVLEAMGVDAHHSLRLSVGWNTTDADIAAFETAFPAVVTELRSLR